MMKRSLPHLRLPRSQLTLRPSIQLKTRYLTLMRMDPALGRTRFKAGIFLILFWNYSHSSLPLFLTTSSASNTTSTTSNPNHLKTIRTIAHLPCKSLLSRITHRAAPFRTNRQQPTISLAASASPVTPMTTIDRENPWSRASPEELAAIENREPWVAPPGWTWWWSASPVAAETNDDDDKNPWARAPPEELAEIEDREPWVAPADWTWWW